MLLACGGFLGVHLKHTPSRDYYSLQKDVGLGGSSICRVGVAGYDENADSGKSSMCPVGDDNLADILGSR